MTEYVYEEEMEEAYRNSLFKSFSKTLEDGFFPVVIVDAIHDKVSMAAYFQWERVLIYLFIYLFIVAIQLILDQLLCLW